MFIKKNQTKRERINNNDNRTSAKIKRFISVLARSLRYYSLNWWPVARGGGKGGGRRGGIWCKEPEQVSNE